MSDSKCPTCEAPVVVESQRWTGTAAMHLDPPEAYDATVRFDGERYLREKIAALTPVELRALGERVYAANVLKLGSRHRRFREALLETLVGSNRSSQDTERKK